MAQYSTVLADEFNTIRNTVRDVLGTGSTTRGYGSPVTSTEVVAGQKIKPDEYTALATDINVCYNHIAGSNASLNSVVKGGKVTWANIVTYQVAATYIDTNRDTNGNTGSASSASGDFQFPSGWGSGRFKGLLDGPYAYNTASGTFTWSSAEAMRHFYWKD